MLFVYSLLNVLLSITIAKSLQSVDFKEIILLISI